MKHTKTLYESSFEHDNCGIGAVVNIDGTKSHKIVDNALCIVEKLEHRAGKDASGQTGDGVGILVQISHSFFTEVAKSGQIVSLNGTVCDSLGDERDYGIGMFFFPVDSFVRAKAQRMIEHLAGKEELTVLGWRSEGV